MMQTGTWDVVVVGSANTDYMVRGNRLPGPGETTLGDQFYMGPGGKGANQAIAAARLGVKVAFIGSVGSDNRGDRMLQQLQHEGVDTRYVRRDAEAKTGAAVIHVEHSGEKQIFMAPNANNSLSVTDIHKASFLQDARVVMLQLEIPLNVVVEAARLASNFGAKVILDPAPPTNLPDDLLHRLTVIKPNSSEARQLTGIDVNDKDSARKAAAKLLERGVEVVAIQAGSKGNLLIWHDGEVWLPLIPVDSVDATGAGDAFAAALAVAIAEGRSWEDAGHLANKTAALTTTQMGAQAAFPNRQQVDQLEPSGSD